jgi:tetratricopeptide (TPR) repeat protein
LITTIVLAAAAAHAQPQSEADLLFAQGKELLAAGKLAEACAKFDASQRLDPTVSTLLNQANCREKNGQLATALRLFRDAEQQTRTASDAAGRQLHDVAARRARELDGRVSTLTVALADAALAGLEVVVDGAPLERARWGTAQPIDGGRYEVVATAPGHQRWSGSVTVGGERDAQRVDIPALSPIAVAPPVDEPDDPAPGASGRGLPVVPIAVGGAGVVALGVALGFELSGRSTYERAKQALDDRAEQDALWSSANTKRYLAQGLAVAGLAAGGVAVWLYLRGRKSAESAESATAAHTHVVPVLAGDHAGVGVVGRF